MLFFFFNATPTTEIYTLSLHDALPIFAYTLNTLADWQLKYGQDIEAARQSLERIVARYPGTEEAQVAAQRIAHLDRKSTRLNSSHGYISYAVFCLKKKKKNNNTTPLQQ